MEELSALLARTRSGDPAAYGPVVRRFQDMAVGYAYSLLGDFQLAEDAAQEAFLASYQDLERLRDPAAFPGWLKRIVFMRCSRIKRRLGATARAADAVPAPPTAEDPLDRLEAESVRARVSAAIRDLPEPERTTIALFYISDLSQKEVAAFLELPVTTVNYRLHAGRERLRKELIDMAREELHEQRPSRDEAFTNRVLSMLPSDQKWAIENHLISVALTREEPATIALILLQLEPARAGGILAWLSAETQGEVGLHLAGLNDLSADALRQIEQRLPPALRALLASQVLWTGGPREAAHILNASDRDTERAVMARLDQADPDLAEKVRFWVFTFEDVAVLDDEALSRVLEAAGVKTVAVALKGASDGLKKRILATLDEAATQRLKEEMTRSLARAGDVEEAQLRLVQTVRQLEEGGRITV